MAIRVRIGSNPAINLKNQSQNIKTLADIPDVDVVELEEGSGIYYNSTSGRYEVRLPEEGLAAAGANGYIQYNSSNSLSASSTLVFNANTGTLSVNGATINSTAFSGRANNALHLGGTSADDLQNSISANASSAYTNAIAWSGNAALAYANAVSYADANKLPKTNPIFEGVITGVDAVFTGNLTVSGTTTYVNTTSLQVGDNIITLNADVPPATAPTENGGIEINRGSSANVQFVWDETNDRWSAGDQWISSNGIFIGNSSSSATANSTVYTGTSLLANNSAFLGGVAAADYQTEAGLAANVATMAANNASFLGGTAAASYQLNSTLAANVATLPANAATFLTGNGTIFVGNTTANISANSILFTVANSTASSNQTPIGFAAGISTVNTTAIAVGANVIANATTIFVGNTTVNAVANSLGLYIANSSSNTRLVVPSAAAYSATNYFLHANGSWVAAGGGDPGGSNTHIQYNDSGVYGGSAGFTFNEATNNVTVANTLTVGGTTINSTIYAGSANNASFLGGTAAASYQLNSTLAANVATLPANAATFLTGNGTISVGNTTANLWANSIVLTIANSTASANHSPVGFVTGTVTQNSVGYFVGSAFVANSTNLLTTGIGSFGGGTLATAQLNVNAASASTIGLLIKSAASQSANTLEIQTSAGGALATIGPDGHLSINKASVSTNTVFSIAGNNNERVDTTATAYGIEATIINALAGNITVALFNGESRNTTTGAAVTGFQAGVIQNASGTMQRGTGAFISSPSVLSGNITTAYGLRISSQKSSANVAAAYGISVEGATDNNFIAGALSLGGVVTAAANINVTGSGTFTVSANVGANVSLSTSALNIGNSTVNSTANSLGLYLANSSSNTKIEVPSAAQRSGQYFLHANGSWTLVSTTPSVNVMTTASSSLAWDSSAYDEYHITAQDANLTIAADAAASPVNGKKVLFYIKDNATPRTLTWTTVGAKCFKAIHPLPTTTLAGKKLFVGAKYIASTDTWDVIAVSSEV